MTDQIQKLKELVATIEAEITRYQNKGIRACVPRARKALQEIKRTAQGLRVELSASVKAAKAAE